MPLLSFFHLLLTAHHYPDMSLNWINLHMHTQRAAPRLSSFRLTLNAQRTGVGTDSLLSVDSVIMHKNLKKANYSENIQL